jgi:hypothetical protein
MKLLALVLFASFINYSSREINVKVVYYGPPSAYTVPGSNQTANDMKRLLSLTDQPVFEAVSTTGVGVFDSLKSIAKQILTLLKAGG